MFWFSPAHSPEQCENILIVYLHTQGKPWSSSKSFPLLQYLSLDRQTLTNKNKNKTLVQVLETWANWFHEFVSWVADPFRFYFSYPESWGRNSHEEPQCSSPGMWIPFRDYVSFQKVNFPQRKYLSNTQMNRPLVTLSRFGVLPDAGPPFEVNTIPLLSTEIYKENQRRPYITTVLFFFLYKLHPSTHSLIRMGIQ